VKIASQLAIVNEFSHLTPRAYTRKALNEYLATRRRAWDVPKSFHVDDRIALLLENDALSIATISSHLYGRKGQYVLGAVSPLKFACSFYKGSYLSQGTALRPHGLATLDMIYVNHEQSPKSSTSRLTQAGLDNAFRNPQRQSTYDFRYGNEAVMIVDRELVYNDRLAAQRGRLTQR
jgi:hypothetical protein